MFDSHCRQINVISNVKRRLFWWCLIKLIMFETVIKDLEELREIYIHKSLNLSTLRIKSKRKNSKID